MKTLLEICCPSVAKALMAQRFGADRIELCTNLEVGGTTPNEGEIIASKQQLKIRVHVLIRSRAGNFVYDENELQRMLQQIIFCKENKIDGVVFGALLNNGEIDLPKTKAMVEAAMPMNTTFHKAFDECKNPFEALEQLIELGVNRILTSGQQPTALQGIEVLKRLHEQANGRILIMPGGSVRSENVLQIVDKTGVSEIHSAAGVLQNENIFEQEILTMKKLLS